MARLLSVNRGWNLAQNRNRSNDCQRDEGPPIRAPAESDSQETTEHRTEEVRDPGARAPDPERSAAALRGEAANCTGKGSRTDQSCTDTLYDARCDEDSHCRRDCADSCTEREKRQAGQRQPTGAEAVDQRPPR